MATIQEAEDNAKYVASWAAHAAGDHEAVKAIQSPSVRSNPGAAQRCFEAVAKYVPDSPQAAWLAAAAKAGPTKANPAPVYIPTPAPAAAASKPVSTYTPAPVVVAAPAATRVRAALTAEDATAITTKANALGLGALGAKLVARGVSYADAVELLTTAAGVGGGAVAHAPAARAGGHAGAVAHTPTPTAGGGGEVNVQAVQAARAFAAARGMGRGSRA
jgi:hypothetical protein